MRRRIDQELLNRPQPPSTATDPFADPAWDDVTPVVNGRALGATDPAVEIDASPEPTDRNADEVGDTEANADAVREANELCASMDAETVEEQEQLLVTTIGELWSSTRATESTIKRSREDLAKVRRELGMRLNLYKNLLSRAGREGKFTGFLRENQIPRATAYRLIEASVHYSAEAVNRLSETITVPTEVDIAKIVSGLKPKLVGRLTTPELVDRFLHALRDALCEALSAAGDPESSASAMPEMTAAH